jgi:amidophosphoribosyltransferase
LRARYPTAGTKSLCAEAQPLYTNYPHGLAIAHNGTLTNTPALRTALLEAHRHVNTGSDSEVLLNVLAMELEAALKRSAQARLAATLTARAQGAGAAKAALESESAASLQAKAVTATRDDVFAACSSAMAKLTGG